MTAAIVCPRCRAEGLSTDCADQITDQKEQDDITVRDSNDSDQDRYDLDVTYRFTVNVAEVLAIGPHDAAQRFREQLLDNEDVLADALLAGLNGEEYDIQVRPVFAE